MSAIKFNHVFVGLLVLSALSAFVINPKYTNRVRNVQGLFAPVASPVRRVALALDARLSQHEEKDHRALADIRSENAELRTTLMAVMGQLEQLKHIDDERGQVGAVRPLCTPVAVVGTDTGTSESLSLAGTGNDAIMQGMAVLYSQGLVGKIDRVGMSGSQVQLVTDRSFRVTARFRYWEKADNGAMIPKYRDTNEVVVQGQGKGAMIIDSVFPKDAEKVQVGDEVVLADRAWPTTVTGQRLGQVTSKNPRRDVAQFFEVHLKPMRNLKELQEVMVLTKVAPTAR